VRVQTPGDVAALVALETIGQSQRFPGLLEWSQPTFGVRSGAPVAVGLDGEALMLEPPLRFASLPGALCVRIPRQAAGVSPAAAAVSLSRTDLRALVRIAAGRGNGRS
jgi:diacylglycerol kinase family enzyme